MPVKKLKEFLDKNDIAYQVITHSRAFTAQQTAASAHIPGKEIAKTVILKVHGEFAMAVLPASYRVDFNMLRENLGTDQIELAQEYEFKNLFPNCETGAMPPFGNLWNMKVYVAESLSDDEEIAFNAGNHTELFKMQYEDFERLVKPIILRISSKSML